VEVVTHTKKSDLNVDKIVPVLQGFNHISQWLERKARWNEEL